MCVRPRFEKDSIFRNTIIVSFPPINYQLFERDRHDFGTWPIFFHAGQLPVSSKDFDRFVGKSVTVQREEETGLGEKPFESISGRGLEIWEERKGESESSSHRDESGSFSSGKNSGSNRDARLATRFDIETDSWTRKRERERYRELEERDENYEEKRFYSRLFDTAIRKISRMIFRGWTCSRVVEIGRRFAIYRYEQRPSYSSSISFSNNFYQDTGQDADHLYNIFETRHRASTWLDEP